MSEVASKTNKQSWAIFTMSGYDIRDCDEIGKEEANVIIGLLKNESSEVENMLINFGAVKKNDSLNRGARFKEAYDNAHKAGNIAAGVHIPEPMHVIERANPLDDNSEIIKRYEPVMDGICGFAWINIRPGNHPFSNWLKKNDLARKDDYYGGVTIWIHDFNQSYEKKLAYADAFCKSIENELNDERLKLYAMSRLD